MNKKSLYICGDSFCVDDVSYGDNWVNLLEKKHNNLEIKNLSSSGASNYLIYLQVKHALSKNCDYLIYNATSSIRQEFLVGLDDSKIDDVYRYWNDNNPNKAAPLICASWLGVDKHYKSIINKSQIKDIDTFFKQFVIFKNIK